MNLEEIHDRVKLLWPDKELAKIYMSGDKFWDNLYDEIPSQLIHGLKKHNKILDDALSQGQIKSKQWLLKNLQGIDLGIVFICAGWYGTLAVMMFEDENIYVDKIRSFDLDDSCWKIAEDFNKLWAQDNWKFKAITQNILDINYIEHSWTFWSKKNNRESYPIIDKPNTIINTSCEHIEKFTEWVNLIPKGKLVALQTNDYFDLPEHVNCVNDITEFKQQTSLNNIIYEGELELEKYTRFMLIGYK